MMAKSDGIDELDPTKSDKKKKLEYILNLFMTYLFKERFINIFCIQHRHTAISQS